MNICEKMTEEDILDLYNFLAHGSDDHRAWLKSALFHYFKGYELLEYSVWVLGVLFVVDKMLLYLDKTRKVSRVCLLA